MDLTPRTAIGAAAVLVTLLVSSCGAAGGQASSGGSVPAVGHAVSSGASGSESPTTASTRTPSLIHESFIPYGLSFAHDPAWTSWPLAEVSSFTSVVTFLSTQRLHEPCATSTPRPGIEAVECGEPVRQLTPDGLLIAWYTWGIPGLRLDAQPGASRTIGGHAARLSRGPATQQCRDLGGTLSVQAWIRRVGRPPNDALVVMDACLTRQSQVAPVLTMLDTVRLAS